MKVSKAYWSILFVFMLFCELKGQNVRKSNDILVSLSKNYGLILLANIPTLEVAEEKIGVACAEMPPSNKIVIDRHFLRCLKGKDSLNALAFVLGHELAHFYFHKSNPNSKIEKTNFACYSNFSSNTNQNLEENCDVTGAFMAYLAGYRIHDVLPEFIEKLYKNYPLDASKMTCYPSLEERRNTAIEVQKKVNRLIQIYEAANYMLMLGQDEMAGYAYQAILDEGYQGAEIYNNLGVCKAKKALRLMKEDSDTTRRELAQYLYPFEVEWETRLRGKKGIGRSIKDEILESLNQANSCFSTATIQQPENINFKTNQLCVAILQGEDIIKNINFSKNVIGEECFQFLGALNVLRKDKNKSFALFDSVAKGNSRFATMAKYNCDELNNIEHYESNIISFDLPNTDKMNEEWDFSMDSTLCENKNDDPSFKLSIKKLPNTFLIQSSLKQKNKTFNSFQMQYSTSTLDINVQNRNIYLSNRQSLLTINRKNDTNEHIIIHFNAQNKVVLWGRYISIFP